MSGQKISRIQKLINKIILSEKTGGYLASIRYTFEPFKDQVKQANDLEKWMSNIQERSNKGILTANESTFMNACYALDTFSKDFFGGYVSPKLTLVITSYAIFKKMPSRFFLTIKHKITTPLENEDFWGTTILTIEPGTTKDEVHDYIDAYWNQMRQNDKYLKKMNVELGRSSLLGKKIRIDSNIERDNSIVDLHRQGLNDRAIAQIVKEARGDLALIRQVIKKRKAVSKQDEFYTPLYKIHKKISAKK